jgi:hypothetical protein
MADCLRQKEKTQAATGGSPRSVSPSAVMEHGPPLEPRYGRAADAIGSADICQRAPECSQPLDLWLAIRRGQGHARIAARAARKDHSGRGRLNKQTDRQSCCGLHCETQLAARSHALINGQGAG